MANRQIRNLWIIPTLRVTAWLVLVGGLAIAVLGKPASTSAHGAWVSICVLIASVILWMLLLGLGVAADLARAANEEIVRMRADAQEPRRS